MGRGLQVVENLCANTSLMMGETLTGISKDQWIEVHNPATNQVVTRVPQSTQAEMEDAVESAKAAGRSWSKSSTMQCNMGAKNHGVIMPDANKEYTINQLVGAAFGAAGQRCVALTTAVMVGQAKDWMEEVAERATK